MDLNPKEIKKVLTKKKESLKDTLKETKRVLKITEKPDREEFMMAAKITGAGILIIGLIGFLFQMGSTLLPQVLPSADGSNQAAQGLVLLAGYSKGRKHKKGE